MKPGLWLDDYHLACRAVEAEGDDFIICNLSLYLTDSTRTWLEHLTEDRIHSWADLREIFVGIFQGMYKRPRNPWDLKSYR